MLFRAPYAKSGAETSSQSKVPFKMNLSEEIVLGEVRQRTNRSDADIRVISVDGGEILFDVSYHASPEWMFGGARGKCYYYRHRVDRLLREIQRAYAGIAGPFIHRSFWVVIDGCEREFIEPAEDAVFFVHEASGFT